MHLPTYALLLLAICPSPSIASTLHSITRLHSIAVNRSASVARDLRQTLGYYVFTAQSPDPGNRKIYCIPKPPAGRNGTSGSTSTRKGSPTQTSVASTPSATSPYTLVRNYEGQDFFTGWSFWTFPDPTHGIVDFVSEDVGRANGLVDVNAQGNAIMRVDTTPQISGNRQSIRITTLDSFMGGLLIMDAVHMPTGCATWPAFWSNGPNWPAGGEIDILEGVNGQTHNQATIHTNPGCSLPTSNPASLDITGTVVGGLNCAAAETNNQGCGVRAQTNDTYGPQFNSNGGGVYAMRWDDTGITVWFFARGEIPDDIEAKSPQTQTWGVPMGRWPATSCDPFKFFYDQVAIFDTTLCGDWAGSAWGASGIPGQDQSCAQQTGFDTCEAFVRARGDAFNEAYWEVRNVRLYQLK